MNSIGRNDTEVKRNSGETFGMSQTIHRFHVEVSVEALVNAKPGSQMGLINPVPATMNVESWLQPDRDVVVYEGTHHGTPADIAALDRVMRVATGRDA